jgi:hypothetical protein
VTGPTAETAPPSRTTHHGLSDQSLMDTVVESVKESRSCNTEADSDLDAEVRICSRIFASDYLAMRLLRRASQRRVF